MIKINGKIVDINHFPDGTLLLKEKVETNFLNSDRYAEIVWMFENNEELVALIFLTKHLRAHGIERIYLTMPYIPNARQDRVKTDEDVFTLKYFADVINYLEFNSVTVLDPHSAISEALFNNLIVENPLNHITETIKKIESETDSDNSTPLMLFYPDEGAMKRYSALVSMPYAFGIKKREWENGKITGLEASGVVEKIDGSRVLIIDDICSRGGTFYFSAKKLKELGAKEIYLYVTHCENTIFEGELLTSSLIDKIYTTNSIFTKQQEKIEVFEL